MADVGLVAAPSAVDAGALPAKPPCVVAVAGVEVPAEATIASKSSKASAKPLSKVPASAVEAGASAAGNKSSPKSRLTSSSVAPASTDPSNAPIGSVLLSLLVTVCLDKEPREVGACSVDLVSSTRACICSLGDIYRCSPIRSATSDPAICPRK